jgi:hypothetical protein
VRRVPHALGQAVHAWKGGSRSWSQGPPSSNGGLESFLSMNSWFYMNFDHLEHSLQGSRLNS